MCGRFAFYSPAEATAALFGAGAAQPDARFEPRYNIAPTQDIAAVRKAGKGDAELVTLRWGLVPSWAKEPSIGNRMINARAETVAGKPAFRDAFRKRRCLVLADGFYEWQSGPGGKTPCYISLASGEPLAFAGLWEEWRDPESRELLQTATIITTEANEALARMHHRMPVVLVPETAERWLAGDPAFLEQVTAGTAPADSPAFRAWPVDRKVNNARTEGPELILPATDGAAGTPCPPVAGSRRPG